MSHKSSRREFVKRSAAAVAGVVVLPHIIPSSALGMGGKRPPSDRIVFGLIGSGNQGNNDMRDFHRLNNEVQFVAISDIDDSRLVSTKATIDEQYNNNDCRTYKDYRELLEKETLDAMLIAIPDHWHGIIYTEVAKKKINVYGEKPICRTINDGKAILKAVQDAGIVWQTGSWQRSDDNFHTGAELVRNDRLGKITYIEVGLPDGMRGIGTPPIQEIPEGVDWDMWLGPALKVPFRGVMHYDWRWILDYSGGQMTDWAGHHIDIANWGADLETTDPIEVAGEGVYPPEGIYDAPFEYDFLCKYASGLEMRVANSSRLEHGQGTVWHGDGGWIHVNRGNVLEASDPEILNTEIGADEIHLYKSENHYQNFIDCVRSGEKTIAPIEAGVQSIKVGLLGEIAMTTGQTIKWDPDTQEIIDNPMASRLLSRPYRKPWTLPTV